jgi:hypothetical protein
LKRRRSLSALVLVAAMPFSSTGMTQTGAELDETARFFVSRYIARTILREAQIDTSRVPALTADWPTDLKLALALDTSSEKKLGLQLDSVKSHLPLLSERLDSELYVESWLRNRLAEMRDTSLQGSAEALELRLNDAAAAHLRDGLRARVRLNASVGETLTGFEQAFRAAVRNVLSKRPDLGPALSALKLESPAILDSRNKLKTALADAEKRLKQ